VSDIAAALLCVSFLFVSTLAWHAWTLAIKSRERVEAIRRNELHANVQDELIQRQAALEARLLKSIAEVEAKLVRLDVASTTELKAMKQEFDRFTAKDAAASHLAMGALQGRKF